MIFNNVKQLQRTVKKIVCKLYFITLYSDLLDQSWQVLTQEDSCQLHYLTLQLFHILAASQLTELMQ